MNARYYVPAIGRFASADTIVPEPGQPQSFNRYSYVNNNPLRFTDPTGHYLFEEDPRKPDLFSEGPYPSPYIWSKLPVAEPDELQWYGNTNYAFSNGEANNYHKFSQGLHPGLDLIGEAGQPVYAGTTGTVECVGNGALGNCGLYNPGRIDIVRGDMTLLYGHLQNIQVRPGDRVNPDTVLGYIGNDHIHLEILQRTEDGQTYMTNPLPYFHPHLQTELLGIAATQLADNPHDSRVTFWAGRSEWRTPYNQPDLLRKPGRLNQE